MSTKENSIKGRVRVRRLKNAAYATAKQIRWTFRPPFAGCLGEQFGQEFAHGLAHQVRHNF